MPEPPLPLFEYHVAASSWAGGSVSGDLYVVRQDAEAVLVAVVDGLGHGPDAAIAARTTIAALASRPRQPILGLIRDCHAALRHTRGAAIAIAEIDVRTATMSWLAVGNVEARLLRSEDGQLRVREAPLNHAGIVGHRLPLLRLAAVALRPGDLVAFATDGIRSGFEATLRWGLPTRLAADRILADYGKVTDDALILVGRWNGADGVR